MSTSMAHESLWKSSVRCTRRYIYKASKSVMRSYRFNIPRYDMPIRLRPWFVLFTSLIMVALAFLGFTNFARSLPLNDKLLHFFCLAIATGVFFFIFDVEEDARRVWLWRTAPLIITTVTCFVFGGIVSEFVQSLLPYKEFQFGDIVANLLGSSIGLYCAYNLERYYRHRREISRLYRPLNADYISDDDEDSDTGTQLLPLHDTSVSGNVSKPEGGTSKSDPSRIRLSDVWDEREELFDIGDDSDEEEGRRSSNAMPRASAGPKNIIFPEP